jgi:undecaprenyl phosphate-alpha-L-ara4N flippase subunit ArnE
MNEYHKPVELREKNIGKQYIAIFLMIFCAICLCLGSFIWKIMPGYDVIYLLGGFAIYAAGALAMIFAYRYGELSVLQPLNSLSYVFSTLIAIFILHEDVSPINIAGISLIVSGVIVIGVNNR